MNENSCSEERFLGDVKEHTMTIWRDVGLDRHIKFRKPNTSCYGFDLITWPGYLCMCGDMGTYVFSRIPDMFEFFRNDTKKDGLFINTGYWAEKCQSIDRRCGIEAYSSDKFRAAVMQYIEGSEIEGLREAVEERVLYYAEGGIHEAYVAASGFEYKGFMFNDFWEVDLNEYTYQYIWCCYAIAWGIRQYDSTRQLPVEKNED